jgi:hypothetical protein
MSTNTNGIAPVLSFLSFPAQSNSLIRAASQLSSGGTATGTGTATATTLDDNNDDRGRQVVEQEHLRAAATNARSAKGQLIAKQCTILLSDKYKDRADIEITASPSQPEVPCGARGANMACNTSRLQSVCGVPTKSLPLKALRVIFTKESIPHFNNKSKKEICVDDVRMVVLSCPGIVSGLALAPLDRIKLQKACAVQH